ncbi:MAG: class I SAM-dependent methyltransferase [Panacagrimonas sp.]
MSAPPATAKTRLSNIRPAFVRDALDRVDWTYMPGDHMLGPTANHHHYREVGESALRCIYGALLMANADAPQSLLDFGCGSGRVTRWLRAGFPDAAIDASDLRTDSLAFVAAQFGARTWASWPDVSALQAPRTYDLIWAASVLTHLPEDASVTLLKKFLSWLAPNGVCIVTTHGRRMRENLVERRLRYIDEKKEAAFLAELEQHGYAYAPYQGQKIGVSASTIAWIMRTLRETGSRVVSVGEHAWDKHQDVIAFQAPGPR